MCLPRVYSFSRLAPWFPTPQLLSKRSLQQQEGARKGSAGVCCTHHYLVRHELVTVNALTGLARALCGGNS